MLTAFGTAADLRSTRELGVATHLQKASFSGTELRARVAEHLGRAA